MTKSRTIGALESTGSSTTEGQHGKGSDEVQTMRQSGEPLPLGLRGRTRFWIVKLSLFPGCRGKMRGF